MFTEKKFNGLSEKTKLKKIADQLKNYRDSLLKKQEYDLSSLKLFHKYLEKDQNLCSIHQKLSEVLTAGDYQAKIEHAHFLFHFLMQEIGYPLSEKQFIEVTTSDNQNFSTQNRNQNFVIILENLRSAFNVGSILRLCDAFNVGKIYLTGLTARMSDDKVLKTSKESQHYLDIQRTEDITSLIENLKEENYKIVAADTFKEAVEIKDFKFPLKTALIFGNEEIGISQRTLALCDNFVKIAMLGFKNSINVANAASIFLYEYSKQNNQ